MDEDAISTLSLRVKLNLTVWEFVLPATPSLPAVFGVSSTHILNVELVNPYDFIYFCNACGKCNCIYIVSAGSLSDKKLWLSYIKQTQ